MLPLVSFQWNFDVLSSCPCSYFISLLGFKPSACVRSVLCDSVLSLIPVLILTFVLHLVYLRALVSLAVCSTLCVYVPDSVIEFFVSAHSLMLSALLFIFNRTLTVILPCLRFYHHPALQCVTVSVYISTAPLALIFYFSSMPTHALAVSFLCSPFLSVFLPQVAYCLRDVPAPRAARHPETLIFRLCLLFFCFSLCSLCSRGRDGKTLISCVIVFHLSLWRLLSKFLYRTFSLLTCTLLTCTFLSSL